MPFAIEVQNLRKSFGDLQAVQGVDFTVEQGEIEPARAQRGQVLPSHAGWLLEPDRATP
jgi:hypothetical protein